MFDADFPADFSYFTQGKLFQDQNKSKLQSFF